MSDGVKIDSRIIPFPQSVSEAAQAALRRLVRDDGVPFNALYPLPAPDDHDAWRQMQIGAARHYAAALKDQAAQTQASGTG